MRATINLLFFSSGFASLVFQVVWQRKLFVIFGVNLESTTVIVSVFMAGLGLGSLFGGWISKRIVGTHLLVFGIAEFLIGICGFVSLPLISRISQIFAGSTLSTITIVSFSLLIVPTLLMGLSLPLLITYINKRYHDVGFSTGSLYFVNTLGAATGVILCGFLFIELWGLDKTVMMAGSIDGLVGMISIFLYLKIRGVSPEEDIHGGGDITPSKAAFGFIRPRIFASIILAFLFGFLALSYEIIFFRLGVFIFHNLAYVFPGVLAPYLAGIAIGSTMVKKWCSRLGRKTLITAVSLELALIVHLFVAIPLCVKLADLLSVPNILSIPNIVVMVLFDLLVVFVPTLFMGATFPLLCHYAVESEAETGPYVSYIYFSNTIGATAGTFLTGFFFIGTLGLQGTMFLLFTLGLFAFAMPVLLVHDNSRRIRRLLYGMVPAVLSFALFYPLLGNTYAHLFRYRQPSQKAGEILMIDETKYGVSVLAREVKSGLKTMYGNGVYDAHATMVMPTGNERALLPVFLHPSPRTVFQIGLGTGTWTKILAANPDVEKITIVEINDACDDLIVRIPEVASILHNPKVEIIIDDGRRWLNAHPERKFDFFCFNTTIHTINFSANVLSYEFYEIIKDHMKPGALILVNPTQGADAYRTFSDAFPYVHVFPRLYGVLIGCLQPFQVPDRSTVMTRLASLRIPEGQLLDLETPEHRNLVEWVFRDMENPQNREKSRLRLPGARRITDDNLPNEYYLLRYLKEGARYHRFIPNLS